MGGCVTNETKNALINKHDSVTRSIPTKIGTIGNNYDYEETFSRSRANAPLISNLDNEYENTLFTRKQTRIRTMTNPQSLPMSEIAMSPRKKSSIISDYSLHNETKVNKYYKNSIDFASGQFAQVFMTNLDKNNTKETRVAIKKINIGDWTNKTTKKSAENELKILKLCAAHINIVKLIDSFYEIYYDNLYLNLVMEFIPITLKHEINKYKSFGKYIPLKLIQIYSYQILNGINYLNYTKHIIHRDLKPENILIDPLTNTIKICDFGCSKYVNDVNNTLSMLNFYVCSRYYRAPELLLESTHYSYEIDIWSFACILCEMYLGNILFNGKNTKEQMQQIIETFGLPTKEDCIVMNKYCQYDILLNVFDDIIIQNKLIKNVPKNVMDLVNKIFKYNPKKRLKPFDAMKHKYFKDLKNNNCQYTMPYGIVESFD